MKVEIKCQTCNESMGFVRKPVVTDEDIALYRQMVTCPNGHRVANLDEVTDPDPDDNGDGNGD